MKIWPDGKPYYSANQYYREIFGDKVYKISLDIGCTCPTRDGTKGVGGCTFCSARGSGDFAIVGPMSIREKNDSAIGMVSSKVRSNKYLAYLQSFTNTYGPVKALVPVYEEILADERVVGLSIGTRPDCLSNAMIKELARLSHVKPIWVELGLATVDYMANQPVSGVKMSMLHILKDSPLYKEYLKNPFPLLDEADYIKWVAEAITRMPPEMVIHRVTGDGDHKNLAAPKWSARKRHVLNGLLRYMTEHGLYQGLNCKAPADKRLT